MGAVLRAMYSQALPADKQTHLTNSESENTLTGRSMKVGDKIMKSIHKVFNSRATSLPADPKSLSSLIKLA
jgi:hypothetical protein